MYCSFVIESVKVGKCDFRRRLECIDREIVGSRNKLEIKFPQTDLTEMPQGTSWTG